MRPMPQPSKRRVSADYDFPAPTGGWRTDVTLSDMPPDAAAIMDNFFPEANKIRARRGNAPYATGLGSGSVNTIIAYNGASLKMFGACGAHIYDITSPGAVGAAAVSGLTNDYWSYTNFTNSGGKWIRLVNGSDTPLLFDGTTWGTSPAITGTGLTTSNLMKVTAYRSRLWFLEKGTTNLWYLGTDAVGGAANVLNVGNVMKHGGNLVAIGVWSIPVYTGINQSLVLVSDQGEIIVYQGSNPADATNWSLLGTFKQGRPIGDRCLLNVGGDLAILTQDAIVPLSQAIKLDRGAIDQGSITAKIAPSWSDAVANCGNVVGWSIVAFPQRRMAIVNVPQTDGTVQFVMNTTTGAWCRFTNIPAFCWETWNDGLYWGGARGTVLKAETGSLDNAAAIDCLAVGAFRRMKGGLPQKQARILSLSLFLGPNSNAFAGISVDYKTAVPTATVAGVPRPVALWDVALWDIALWPGDVNIRRLVSSGAVGIAFAPTIRALISGDNSTTSACDLIGGSIAYEAGAPV